MAYSRMPYVQTYETKRVEFPTNPLGRSGLTPTKDASLTNMMVDVTKGFKQPNVFFRSRPGLTQVWGSGFSAAGRGLHYWNHNGVGYIVCVVGANVYSNFIGLMSLSTSTGTVGFTEYVASTGVVSLVMCDGVNGYVFSDPTLAPTLITDTNFPTPHIPAPVFLDGYIFLAKASSEDIYNSDLNSGPTVWTTSGSANYVSAEMYPDNIVTISKNNNYVYAIGSGSVEYFYDAGTTGAGVSPLARQAPAVQQFGAASMGSVVQTEKEVILVGETGNGGKTVWIIEGFKPKEIGTTWVKGVLLTEGTNISNCIAYTVRVSGQKLYILQLTSRTLVYNFDTELWSEWTSASGAFIGYRGDDGPGGTPYVLHATLGYMYTMSENVYTDAGTNFTCQIITEKQDFGAIDRKQCSRFALIGDVPDPTGVYNNVTISWSDDDYNTWSTPRTLSFNNDFPVITQLGVFRRRAFKIQYSSPCLFRVEGYELNLNKGVR